MTADLTREQAREQVARAIHDVQCVGRCEWAGAVDPWHPMRLRLADAALTVLWPVVEGLRADLAHAHTIIARHVEPLRKPCRPEAGDCCDGDAHTWQPAQGSRLPDCAPAAAPVGARTPGRVRVRGRKDHG